MLQKKHDLQKTHNEMSASSDIKRSATMEMDLNDAPVSRNLASLCLGMIQASETALSRYMYQNGENIKILDRAIQPEFKHDRDILDQLWASLPRNPNICWYPSSGLCFRDLMVWKSEGVSGHFEEPDLYIHTDFVADYAASRCLDYEYRDGLSCIQVKSSHTMPVCGPVDHRVRRSWISLPDCAAPAPLVTIKEIVAESFQFGVSKKPVLFFHFENFNWFDQFVIKNGLRISHFFKVREGCGRLSVIGHGFRSALA